MFSQFFSRTGFRNNFRDVLNDLDGDKVVQISSRTREHQDHVVMTNTRYEKFLAAEEKLARLTITEGSVMERTARNLNSALRLLQEANKASSWLTLEKKHSLSPEGISSVLDLDEIDEFECYLRAEKLPKRATLERFCEIYGFDRDRMINGYGPGFSDEGRACYRQIYQDSIENHYNQIKFVMFNDDMLTVYIFLGDGAYNWKMYSGGPMDGHKVGSGGRGMQRSLFEVIKMVKSCHLSMSESTFEESERANIGVKHPAYFALGGELSHWADDFSDAEPGSQTCIQHDQIYPPGYVAAMETIRGACKDQSYAKHIREIKDGRWRMEFDLVDCPDKKI